MDDGRRMEYQAYLLGKEYYLRKLGEQGLLTSEQLDRIDQLQRQYYHADETEELLRKEKLKKEELALLPKGGPESVPEYVAENISPDMPLTNLTHPHGINANADANKELLRKKKHKKEIALLPKAGSESASEHTSVQVTNRYGSHSRDES